MYDQELVMVTFPGSKELLLVVQLLAPNPSSCTYVQVFFWGPAYFQVLLLMGSILPRKYKTP